MVTQTVTITVNEVRKQKKLFNSPSDSPPSSSNSSNSPNTSITKSISQGKEKIVRILAKFNVRGHENMVIPVENLRKTAYRLLKVRENVEHKFNEVFDPSERDNYAKLMIVENKLIWEHSRVPTSVYLVRNNNNSVSLVYPQKAKDARHAWLMYEFAQTLRNANALNQTKKAYIQERTHYHFEAVERNALSLIEKLGKCISMQECTKVFKDACVEKTKHPDVIKAIYKYARKQGMSSHLTWEEICFV